MTTPQPLLDGAQAPRMLEAQVAVAEAPVPLKSRQRIPRARLVFATLVTSCAVAASVLYWRARGTETTDDAQVETHVATVSSRVTGQVVRVLVRDNQTVAKGDVLVELDDRDSAAKLAAVKADLAAAIASRRAAETQVTFIESTIALKRSEASSDLTALRAKWSLARERLNSARQLFADDSISRNDLGTQQLASDQATSELLAARARLESLRAPDAGPGPLQAAQITAAQAQVDVACARVQQAQAQVEQATLNESFTKVIADVSGVVAHRVVEVGQLASPERPLMALVSLDDPWVVANFKEDQVANMREGERATVTIDALRGRPLAGWVDGLGGGTGSRFSLLPPDNASGNFTKVVQRVPVLVRLADHPGLRLRPGMSAAVTVRTRED